MLFSYQTTLDPDLGRGKLLSFGVATVGTEWMDKATGER